MTSVGIVADRSLFLDCLTEVLRSRTEIELVATAGTAADLDSIAREVAVLLVDHTSAVAQSTVRHVSGLQDGPPVVVYGVPETEHHIVEYLETGATVVVLNSESVDELVVAVEGALRNEFHCKPRVAAMLAKRLHDVALERGSGVCGSTLTDRELDIVDLLDKGLSNKEIAHRLGIKVATVKNHVHSILSKLNVNRRGEAAALIHGRLSSPVIVNRLNSQLDSGRLD